MNITDLLTGTLAVLLQTIVALWPIFGTAITGWAVLQIERWTRLKLDEKGKENLHSALQNGMVLGLQQLAMARAGQAASPHTSIAQHMPLRLDQLTPDELGTVTTVAKQYVRETSPGAIRRFKLDDPTLLDLLVTKLPTAISILSPLLKR